MQYWRLAIGELAVAGLLLCSYSIGSATWAKTTSIPDNQTEVRDVQISIWQSYACDSYDTYSIEHFGGANAVGTLGQALSILTLIVCAANAILIPVFFLVEAPRHASRILNVFCVFGYLNAALQVAGAFSLTNREDGLSTNDYNLYVSILTVLLHLVAGILTSVVATTRYFLKKLEAKETNHKILTGLGTGGLQLLLLAGILTFAMIRSPHWRTNGTVSEDFFVYCTKTDSSFEDAEKTFKGVQALMVLGMLFSVATTSLVTLYLTPQSSPSLRSKLIRAFLIISFFGGIIVVIALVTMGAKIGSRVSFSFVTALLSASCSLAISGIGVLRRVPE